MQEGSVFKVHPVLAHARGFVFLLAPLFQESTTHDVVRQAIIPLSLQMRGSLAANSL